MRRIIMAVLAIAASLGTVALAADLHNVVIEASKDQPLIIGVMSGKDLVAEVKVKKAGTLKVEAESISFRQAPGGDKIYYCTGAVKVEMSGEGKPAMTVSGESVVIQPINLNASGGTSK